MPDKHSAEPQINFELQMFKSIVESSEDAIISKTLTGIIQSWNHGAERIFGYTAREVIGRPMLILIPKERRSEESEILLRICRGERVDPFETVRMHKDGSLIDISATISPVFDAQGRVIGASKIAHDIKVRKLKEKAIIEREARMRAILNSTVNAIISINGQGIVESFNKAAETIFGYQAADITGKNVNTLMPEPFHSAHDMYLNNYLTTGVTKIIGIGREVKGRRKDGSIFPMELAVNAIHDEGTVSFVGVITDISERKEKEKRLSEQLKLAKFRADVGVILASSASLQVMLRQFTEHIVAYLGVSFARVWIVNGSVLKLQASSGLYTHIDGGHALIPVGKFKIGLIAQEVRPHLTNSVQTDPLVSNPEWAKREGMVAFAGYPLVAEDEVIGVVAMFSKETLTDTAIDTIASVANNLSVAIKNKQSEQKLIEAKEEAEKANRLKSEFLNMMSHELRTPLTVMLGNLPLLTDVNDMPPADEIAEIAGDIEGSGRHLLTLINDLLDFSKIEAGQMTLNMESLALSDVIREAIAAIAPMAAKKSLLIETHVSEAAIYGDIIRIKQIMYNLIGNAIKFTDSGKITVTAASDNEFAHISVTDMGIGMKKEDIPFIFDKFRQVDGSATRAAGGTGLGLAITKQLVELHGGTIHVKSEYRKGSVFTFTIPVYRGDNG
ncbi:MAG: PAS domain S-box protein [Candidatus Magnetominusculus sp. LBB02]|nr:PAS domain S-box protein [Candidatus Magnetominusculus sp. LBB02]